MSDKTLSQFAFIIQFEDCKLLYGIFEIFFECPAIYFVINIVTIISLQHFFYIRNVFVHLTRVRTIMSTSVFNSVWHFFCFRKFYTHCINLF